MNAIVLNVSRPDARRYAIEAYPDIPRFRPPWLWPARSQLRRGQGCVDTRICIHLNAILPVLISSESIRDPVRTLLGTVLDTLRLREKEGNES